MSGFFVTQDEHWINVDKIVLIYSCLAGVGRVILVPEQQIVKEKC
jgi:hypothetical protein